MNILIRIPRRISRTKLRWSLAGLLLFFCIGAGWALLGHQPTHFSGKDALPVNGIIDSQKIQFSTEAVQPELRGENYFVDYRLRREQSRQEEKTMLVAVLNSNIEKTKEEAQQKWLELTHRISKEDEIENLLKIKGFQDAVVDLAPNSVNIILFAASLAPHELSIIQDITLQVTPVRLDRINISVRK
ncbi:SpoIIIAH-like family protein [Desulfitobacterium sp.]|uniref:SpoIIIAH-like family protein n=1 Tax=Desulfitobacterium sp. TaxID=49981 RepID=UPI002D14B0FB|nr:SpoIIIAH-like family protein [Desulfitobacterium sp.]HVJ48913.1 SpoIIIAH-like family protein [Desulfitobacterium sp.]